MDPGCGSAAIPDSLSRFRLDRGESAVIALALLPSEQETEVVLDDLAARRCAGALGLKVCGSLSFLLIAKAEGRIPLVRPLIEELRRGGMRLSADLSVTSSTWPTSDDGTIAVPPWSLCLLSARDRACSASRERSRPTIPPGPILRATTSGPEPAPVRSPTLTDTIRTSGGIFRRGLCAARWR